jgi:DNA modification methylase/DNA-binding transcriptional regulator YiaG
LRFHDKAPDPSQQSLDNGPNVTFDLVTAGAASNDILAVPGVALQEIRRLLNVSKSELSQLLGSSLISVARWERGDSQPSPDMVRKILLLRKQALAGERPDIGRAVAGHTFASRGARAAGGGLPLFGDAKLPDIALTSERQLPLLDRLRSTPLWGDGVADLAAILADHTSASPTLAGPSTGGISAGKNTYTYDAHTYHTKVPPQGIAEVIKQYLPSGGVVLDPFAGSGMTGVAGQVLGCDVILNELSPAASFISDRFTRRISPQVFRAGIQAVCRATAALRRDLYQTHCRECGNTTELQYTVWSYKVRCPACNVEFVLWDHCRSYGKTVREHKILSEFSCPGCQCTVRKSRLARTVAVPVVVGYKCCSKVQVEHPPSSDDLIMVDQIQQSPPLAKGDYPILSLPDGINLCQPKRHGLDAIDKFYTPRNLSAMSHLWRAIHHIEDANLAGYLGFVFTSLYQRVTRLSEYRFWGGSGNTANFNVPYIFNEANVFATFERKARTIQDHLETTARRYHGRCVVHTGSATALDFIPDGSVDLVFTDPPFGANINYSEMNILWESWFGVFTDNRDEAIVNRYQGKTVASYGDLMKRSLAECHRVLRPGHWLLMVFMNSSHEVWEQLRRAIEGAGFAVERMDIFDKQHGTFKQFVSDNTAGADLILHCRKVVSSAPGDRRHDTTTDELAVGNFLRNRGGRLPTSPYLHVKRDEEIDYRTLYSEWIALGRLTNGRVCDFAAFRSYVVSAAKLLTEGSGDA